MKFKKIFYTFPLSQESLQKTLLMEPALFRARNLEDLEKVLKEYKKLLDISYCFFPKFVRVTLDKDYIEYMDIYF
jgi:hypothetical protein